MIYCGSQEFTALFLILSTGPSAVFPLLLDAGNNCVPVIFSSKTERRKVLTSDIFVILEFIEFCQHARGFYRTDTETNCPSLLQSDLTPGNQCRQRLSSWSLEKPPTGWGPHLCLSAPKARGVVTSVLQLKCKRNPISTATTERACVASDMGQGAAQGGKKEAGRSL